MSSGLPSAPQPSSAYGEQRRPSLPLRAPRAREGHERKRSRLSSDASPFDSVDYWIQFDNEDALAGIPENAEPLKSEPERKASTSTAQR